MSTTQQEATRLPVRSAAKAIGKSREYVRKLIESGAVQAFKIGETDGHPWLVVDVQELRDAHEQATRYVPSGPPEKAPRRRPEKNLNPAALDMRRKR